MHLPCVINPRQSAAAVSIPKLIPTLPTTVDAVFVVVVSALLSLLSSPLLLLLL
jgi:hypothetical protein